MPTNISEVVRDVFNCDPVIRSELVYETSDPKYNESQSEISVFKVSASEDSVLELRLDIDELQEFYSMCTRPTTRSLLSQLITYLETECKDIAGRHRCNLKEERKWSDIVAGRHSRISETNPTTPQPIETVITSKSSQHLERMYGLTTRKTPNPRTMEEGNKYHQNKKPSINILGDSHARGIAGELLYQLHNRYNITGHVKPNAGLTEVLKTVNKDLSKLTKTDAIIVVGGSNDIDKDAHRGNLTSLVKFLDDTQNTNIILTDVPMRNDVEVGSPFNEQIKNYNKKLHKVMKRFNHVTLTKVTTIREHFTKHGFHLNMKGKETLSKELIKHLPIKKDNQKDAAIQLPWRNETGKVGVQTIQTEKLNETLDTDTDTVIKDARELCNITSSNYTNNGTVTNVELKILPSFNVQHGDKQESNQTLTQKKRQNRQESKTSSKLSKKNE